MFDYYSPGGEPACGCDCHRAALPAGLHSVAEVVAAWGGELSFPDWSGHNLDAFWDSIRDLDAIGPRRIVMLHRDFPPLSEVQAQAYVELLRDAVLFWEAHSEEHCLEVWFPRPVRDQVEEMVGFLPPPADLF